MTNKEAYEALESTTLQWGRKDPAHIYVWVPGYAHQDCNELEKYLMQAGMRLVSSEFDRMCGKTQLIFKHKAAA